MAADGAPLSEEEVRDRVHLRHQNLADVRSLSLPGSYHKKITDLGDSLKNFICLKSLDLSRNALTTLEIKMFGRVKGTLCDAKMNTVELPGKPIQADHSSYRDAKNTC
ncbi:hypothetical protein JRQ81_005432 [Phrynocephalus forsythii]|uniref:Uncharacterized protein n=1 Tax=Phrynocephalus forsythii TaxID=171643 RepID=A0A9Q0XGB2_9SAUR|nr:hypothetical protein JRQ81_005432 [Phrynocephalus forsythii]